MNPTEWQPLLQFLSDSGLGYMAILAVVILAVAMVTIIRQNGKTNTAMMELVGSLGRQSGVMVSAYQGLEKAIEKTAEQARLGHERATAHVNRMSEALLSLTGEVSGLPESLSRHVQDGISPVFEAEVNRIQPMVEAEVNRLKLDICAELHLCHEKLTAMEREVRSVCQKADLHEERSTVRYGQIEALLSEMKVLQGIMKNIRETIH